MLSRLSESRFSLVDESSIDSQSSFPKNAKSKTQILPDECTNDTADSPPRKQVSFCRSVRVRKISSHKNFSPEERARSYYSEEDMERIQKRAISIIKKMVRGINVDEDEHGRWCSRGLENKTPEKNCARQTRRQMIIDAVLDEQEYQIEEAERKGQKNIVLDEDIISDIYSSHSQCCIAEALEQAKIDEAAA